MCKHAVDLFLNMVFNFVMDELKIFVATHGLTKVARQIGISPQLLDNWLDRGVPVLRCADVERVSGGFVSRKKLRPDDWQRIWPELNNQQPAGQGT